MLTQFIDFRETVRVRKEIDTVTREYRQIAIANATLRKQIAVQRKRMKKHMATIDADQELTRELQADNIDQARQLSRETLRVTMLRAMIKAIKVSASHLQ